MTCIIGLIENGKVYMGADSAYGNGDWARVTKRSKIFTLGDLLIGITGSPRYDQILRYHTTIEPQTKNQSDFGYLVTGLVDPFRRMLKEYGYSNIESNREKVVEWMMVGYRGNLYTVYGDFQVGQFVDSFSAVGSGDQYALAAMAALEGMSPKKRIRKALEIASRFQPGYVMPPFKVKVLG